ncbi:hypothetical protein Y027_5728 [Burkholderia pseudomallei TSV5]|nr:hypothetical protein Y027_5728 [Burkholderia pseudomallei TSV5]
MSKPINKCRISGWSCRLTIARPSSDRSPLNIEQTQRLTGTVVAVPTACPFAATPRQLFGRWQPHRTPSINDEPGNPPFSQLNKLIKKGRIHYQI